MTNALEPRRRGPRRVPLRQHRAADAIIADGLWRAFDACLMGLGTERYTAGSISREAQDD